MDDTPVDSAEDTNLVVTNISKYRFIVDMKNPADADDIVQEATIQFLKKVRSYGHSGVPIRNPKALAKTILRRRYIDSFRKHVRRKDTVSVEEVGIESIAVDDWNSINNRIDLEMAMETINKDARKVALNMLDTYESDYEDRRRDRVVNDSIRTDSSKYIVLESIVVGDIEELSSSEDCDLLTTWIRNDRSQSILVDKHINSCAIEAFEHDLFLIMRAGGFGHVDLLGPDESCIRYTVGKLGVCSHVCKLAPVAGSARVVYSPEQG